MLKPTTELTVQALPDEDTICSKSASLLQSHPPKTPKPKISKHCLGVGSLILHVQQGTI